MTKTFRELLDEALEEKGYTKSELGREVLGRKAYPFQGYYDLVGPKDPSKVGKKPRLKLTPELIEKLTAFLGKPPNYFTDTNMTARRAHCVKTEFAKFMETQIARETRESDPEILDIIEAIPWNGNKLPTKALYVAICIAMTNGKYKTEQLLVAEQENRALDEMANLPEPPEKPAKRKQRKPGRRHAE